MVEIFEPPARLTVDELFSLFATAECKFFPLSATIICSLSLNGMRARERELQRMFIKIVECLLEHLLRRLHSLTSTIRGEDLVHVKVVDNVMSSLAFSFAVRERCARWFDEGQSSERVWISSEFVSSFWTQEKKLLMFWKLILCTRQFPTHTNFPSCERAAAAVNESFVMRKLYFSSHLFSCTSKWKFKDIITAERTSENFFSSLIYDLAALFKLDKTLCSSRHILADEKRCWSLSNIKRKKEARESPWRRNCTVNFICQWLENSHTKLRARRRRRRRLSWKLKDYEILSFHLD